MLLQRSGERWHVPMMQQQLPCLSCSPAALQLVHVEHSVHMQLVQCGLGVSRHVHNRPRSRMNALHCLLLAAYLLTRLAARLPARLPAHAPACLQ